jgi:hypothetical protein
MFSKIENYRVGVIGVRFMKVGNYFCADEVRTCFLKPGDDFKMLILLKYIFKRKTIHPRAGRLIQ